MPSGALHKVYRRPPAALRFMAAALLPRRRYRAGQGIAPLSLRWQNVVVEPAHLASFLALTGLPAGRSLSILYPQVLSFRLQMALLTHPAFPLPLWSALQIRNRLILHRPLGADEPMELTSSVAAQRLVDKGIEVDLRTALTVDAALVWEGTTTFYYRGRFGAAGDDCAGLRPPEVDAAALATWQAGSGSGWRFGELTGDFNGIHWSDTWARWLGFRRAFNHPQRVLGQCLARLPAPPAQAVQGLETWLRGPVYYGAGIELRAASGAETCVFALQVEGDQRPAIIGRWAALPA